uniref:Uncharacterized protein n=1 Tax=Bombyx mori TaxID=7091 RepID=A0A8R2HSU6_BOMMO|nr:uncharacterized protein LOC110385888 [Bombyx mori]
MLVPAAPQSHIPHAPLRRGNLAGGSMAELKKKTKAAGAPWYVRNVDLHDDMDLESISKYLQSASVRHFGKVARYENRGRRKLHSRSNQINQNIMEKNNLSRHLHGFEKDK